MHLDRNIELPRLSRLAVAGLGLSVALVCCQTVSGKDESAANFFSVPSEHERPRFLKNKPGGREPGLPIFGGLEEDGVPQWPQVRMIPSLTGEQREEIRQIYESCKREVEEQMSVIKSARKKQSPDGSRPPGQSGGSWENMRFSGSPPRSFALAGGQGPEQPMDDGPVLPGSSAIRGPSGQFSPEEIMRFKSARRDVDEKRRLAWERVKSLLSEKNLRDLELMKRGELTAEAMSENPTLPPVRNMMMDGK